MTAALQITCADSDEHVIFSCDQSIQVVRVLLIEFFQTKVESIRWRVPLRTHRLSSMSLRTTAISRCWLWSGDQVWGRGRNGSFSSRLKSAMELTRRTWRVSGSSWDSCCWHIFQRQKFPSSWSENFFGWRRGEINLNKSNPSSELCSPAQSHAWLANLLVLCCGAFLLVNYLLHDALHFEVSTHVQRVHERDARERCQPDNNDLGSFGQRWEALLIEFVGLMFAFD